MLGKGVQFSKGRWETLSPMGQSMGGKVSLIGKWEEKERTGEGAFQIEGTASAKGLGPDLSRE